MVLIRDVFRLKFGKARDAVATWKEMGELSARLGWHPGTVRILTDLVGPYYTLVMETTFEDLGTWEKELQRGMSDPEWRAAYQKFTPLVESGYREIFNVLNV